MIQNPFSQQDTAGNHLLMSVSSVKQLSRVCRRDVIKRRSPTPLATLPTLPFLLSSQLPQLLSINPSFTLPLNVNHTVLFLFEGCKPPRSL